MQNDPRFQEIEAGEHQGQREEDGDWSSGENRGCEVGAEVTPIHEKTGMKTKWAAAPGLQDRHEPLSAAAASPEAAQTADAAQAEGSAEAETAGLRESSHNLSIRHWRRVLFIDEPPFELCHPPNHQNDRAWSGDSPEVPITNNIRRPAKAMVRVMISFCGLPHLHIMPAAKL